MKAVIYGFLAALILLGVYIIIVSSVSGWNFMLLQLKLYWGFLAALAAGFGLQVGLFSHLKAAAKNHGFGSGKTLAVTGTTSTAAMISCCAHYAANLLPVLSAVGVITLISQYQVEFFWVGIAFNLAGLSYMLYQVKKFYGSK